ncbi:MAG: heavy metal translocating P-type ATPase [Clostridia bacterium]|nr:heavy metal translocating P-type ATPase [Clostridia bacterium]
MQQYHVTGMSCAACAARVEKAVRAVHGVSDCSVSLLTNAMGVEGTAESADIIAAVEKAGYGARVAGAKAEKTAEPADELRDTETPRLKKRLIASVAVLLVLMYFSMGHMLFHFPLPGFMEGNPVSMGLMQMILSAVILLINQKFFISGFQSVRHGAPNMDTLVAMGSGVSFLWSIYVLFRMTVVQVHAGSEAAMGLMEGFYFESAAMILTLITVGKMLEARSKGKTTNALKSLIRMSPQSALLERDGQEIQVAIDEVRIGDIFLVKPGDAVPVDGVILSGMSAVNEASLTGESMPVEKQAGDHVYAATLNTSGFLRCSAERVGEDTTLSQIIQMVKDAAATKAPIARLADKVSGIFVPVVIGIAAVTMLIWLLTGHPFAYALERGIAVLVISCPCALGLATPVAIMVGNGVGAKNGILFKTAVSLENTGKTAIVALDKTGTITKGSPVVTDILPAVGEKEEQLLRVAGALEKQSEHPLARAVMAMTESRQMEIPAADSFSVLPGHGIRGIVDGKEAQGGSVSFMQETIHVTADMAEKAQALSDQGKTPLLFSYDHQLIGMIAVADPIKEDSCHAIASLKKMGIRTVMLTGDNARTARAISAQAGVESVVSDVLPEGKEQVIRSLQSQGTVIMVGDGINDAPALTRADIGMAIGAGTDVAIDSADVVLMHSSLEDVASAIRLSRATLRNIRENLFWAFIYNLIGIPLAAGLFVPIFGWEIHPMFGAAAMSLSSFCVVSNALRLNLVNIHSDKHDRPIVVRKKKERKAMEKTLVVDGMMCTHCENRVKKALEKLDGVEEAIVSHEKGTAVVKLSKEVSDDTLKNAVEEQDYEVKSIA